MTLRLEGRSVSGDQFRAASGRIFGDRFPLTSLDEKQAAALFSLDLECVVAGVLRPLQFDLDTQFAVAVGGPLAFRFDLELDV